MADLLDFLEDFELSDTDYKSNGEYGVCPVCGERHDPEYDDGICDRCGDEIRAQLRAFFRTFTRHELMYISSLGEDVFELADREYFAGDIFY